MAGFQVPDSVEPVVAWRVWIVIGRGRTAQLRSVYKPTVWEPHRPLEATCMKLRLLRRSRSHEPPDYDCACGIYAAELPVAATYLDGFGLGAVSGQVRKILGQVAVWGEIVESEQGFRASFGYPHRLFVPGRDGRGRRRDDAPAVATALASYGVPVEIMDADDRSLPTLLAGSSGLPWLLGTAA